MSYGKEGHVPEEDLSGCSDAELLAFMAKRHADQDQAVSAWGAFYRRHFEYMRFVCNRAYGDQLGEAVLDLVHDTFVRCYEHAHTFSLETGVEENAEDTAPTRRNVRAWLGTIAARLFYTWLKQSKTLQLIPIEKAQIATIGTGGVEAAEGSPS